MTIYLDYAASTPVDPAVVDVMAGTLAAAGLQANAAAAHSGGRQVRARVDMARAEVAALIGAQPQEVIWTSGATESNNLAVVGAARLRAALGRHVVTSATEHVSVLAPLRRLEQQGFEVTYLVPGREGLLEPDRVVAALRPDTTLVSIMQVNNETGVVQDVAAIGRSCRERGVLLHVDAAQAAGREAIDVEAQCIDLLSLSAHKMYGPKGVGALFVSSRTARRVEPLLLGGSQERGMRPGTVATHQVAGMGCAARLARERLGAEPARLRSLRDALALRIRQVPGVLLNGDEERRTCHILNVSVVGVEGESLLLGLEGLAVSGGAACAADSDEPSAVLRHLGRPDELAASSIRFSVGRFTTDEEVTMAANMFALAVTRLRAISPAVVC